MAMEVKCQQCGERTVRCKQCSTVGCSNLVDQCPNGLGTNPGAVPPQCRICGNGMANGTEDIDRWG